MTWYGGVLAGIGALYLLGWCAVGAYWLACRWTTRPCPRCGARRNNTRAVGRRGVWKCAQCRHEWESS